MGFIDDFEEIMRKQDELKQRSPFRIMVTQEQHDLFGAILNCDKDKQHSIIEAMQERQRLFYKKENTALRESLSDKEWVIFGQIDIQYTRCHGYCRTADSNSEWSYYWMTNIVLHYGTEEDREGDCYDPPSLSIRLNYKKEFTLGFSGSDYEPYTTLSTQTFDTILEAIKKY